jgi:mRNA-degrading endonuclease RelE of RelBE toxin-antitoxin system
VKAVYFTPAATRQWRSLSADIRRRIDAKLTTYVINGSGDVKRLKGHGGGCRFELVIGALSSSKMPDRSP